MLRIFPRWVVLKTVVSKGGRGSIHCILMHLDMASPVRTTWSKPSYIPLVYLDPYVSLSKQRLFLVILDFHGKGLQNKGSCLISLKQVGDIVHVDLHMYPSWNTQTMKL